MRIDELELAFGDFRYRVPYKFGGREVDRVTVLNVRCRLSTKAGKSATGAASMPLDELRPCSFPNASWRAASTGLAVTRTQPVVENLFYENVVAWLDANEIRYTPNVKFTGVSGYDHHFDFAIAKYRAQPERIVQAINCPTRESGLQFINAWSDTRQVRARQSKAYAVLNDGEPVSGAVIDALRNYDIQPVLWRERGTVVSELAA